MNSRDRSALLLCGATQTRTLQVRENVGLCSLKTLSPNLSLCIILPDIHGLRVKVVGFLVPWVMQVTSYSSVHWNSRGKRKWRVLLFSWHDWMGKAIKHNVTIRYDLIKSLNRKSCRTSWCHLIRNILLTLQNNRFVIQLFALGLLPNL